MAEALENDNWNFGFCENGWNWEPFVSWQTKQDKATAKRKIHPHIHSFTCAYRMYSTRKLKGIRTIASWLQNGLNEPTRHVVLWTVVAAFLSFSQLTLCSLYEIEFCARVRADLYLNDIIFLNFHSDKTNLEIFLSHCKIICNETLTYLRFVYLVAASETTTFIDHIFMREDHSHSRVVFVYFFLCCFHMKQIPKINRSMCRKLKQTLRTNEQTNERNIHWKIFANVECSVVLLCCLLISLRAVIKKIVIKLLPLTVLSVMITTNILIRIERTTRAHNRARILIRTSHTHTLSSFLPLSLFCWFKKTTIIGIVLVYCSFATRLFIRRAWVWSIH